jgi:hypothetical protein
VLTDVAILAYFWQRDGFVLISARDRSLGSFVVSVARVLTGVRCPFSILRRKRRLFDLRRAAHFFLWRQVAHLEELNNLRLGPIGHGWRHLFGRTGRPSSANFIGRFGAQLHLNFGRLFDADAAVGAFADFCLGGACFLHQDQDATTVFAGRQDIDSSTLSLGSCKSAA